MPTPPFPACALFAGRQGSSDNRVGEEIADPNNNGNKFYVNPRPDIRISGNAIEYEYKGNRYFLNVEGADVRFVGKNLIELTATSEDGVLYLYPDTMLHSIKGTSKYSARQKRREDFSSDKTKFRARGLSYAKGFS